MLIVVPGVSGGLIFSSLRRLPLAKNVGVDKINSAMARQAFTGGTGIAADA